MSWVNPPMKESGMEGSTGTELHNRVPRSHEILMFVCLQKDARQCCGVTSAIALIVLAVEDQTTSTIEL